VQRDCPHCGKGSGPMVATVGPAANLGPLTIGPVGKGIVLGLVSLVLFQGVAYLWFLKLRARRTEAEDSLRQIVVCRCPFCNRKIGYSRAKTGSGALCPRCKTAFTLPAESIAEGA